MWVESTSSTSGEPLRSMIAVLPVGTAARELPCAPGFLTLPYRFLRVFSCRTGRVVVLIAERSRYQGSGL